jgi:hypothetical protein
MNLSQCEIDGPEVSLWSIPKCRFGSIFDRFRPIGAM